MLQLIGYEIVKHHALRKTNYAIYASDRNAQCAERASDEMIKMYPRRPEGQDEIQLPKPTQEYHKNDPGPKEPPDETPLLSQTKAQTAAAKKAQASSTTGSGHYVYPPTLFNANSFKDAADLQSTQE